MVLKVELFVHTLFGHLHGIKKLIVSPMFFGFEWVGFPTELSKQKKKKFWEKKSEVVTVWQQNQIKVITHDKIEI